MGGRSTSGRWTRTRRESYDPTCVGRSWVGLPGTKSARSIRRACSSWRRCSKRRGSSLWHKTFGGGLWFAYLNRRNTISLSLARGEGRTAFYLRSGFMF
jgi:hypothetical protein